MTFVLTDPQVGDRGYVSFPNGAAFAVVVHEREEDCGLIVRQVRHGRVETFDHHLVRTLAGAFRTQVADGLLVDHVPLDALVLGAARTVMHADEHDLGDDLHDSEQLFDHVAELADADDLPPWAPDEASRGQARLFA